MKILKEGLIPNDKVHGAGCSKCSCVFQFYESEASHFEHGEHDTPYMQIHCPHCNLAIRVPGGYREKANG